MEKFEWVSFPLKDESLIKNFIAFLAFLLMLLVGYVYLGFVGLFISIIAVFITFLPYILPTRYTLENGKLKVRFFFYDKIYELEKFKSYYIDDKGILLSPFERPHKLENFRGVYVRFGKYKDVVKKLIEDYYKK